ncbi:MAG: outer membrane protein transport protein [Deltaproteobacteria bacterium]|nr:outer membrane protein transport protein [Deltaproteobacteria bacterium]
MPLGALSLVLVLSMPAAAGNDDEVFFSGDAAMSGGAVTAMSRSGASLMYNPAGLANLREDTVNLSLSALTWRRSAVPDLLRSSAGERSGGTLVEFLVVPAALAYVRPIAERLRLAFGLFQVRSASFRLQSALALVAADDTTQDWQLAVAVSEETYDGSIGLGWGVGDSLSLGVSLHILFDTGSTSIQLGGASTAPGATTPEAFAGQSAMGVGSVWSWRPTFGLQWQATEHIRLGLAVAPPSLLIHASRSRSMFIDTKQVPSLGDPEGDFVGDQGRETKTGFEPVAPARIRASLALTVGEHWLAIDGDYQPPRKQSEVNSARDGVWNLRLGGQLAVGGPFRIGAGLFTDRGAARDVEDFGSRRVDFYGGSMGLHFGKTRAFAPEEEDDDIHFDSAFGVRYAYGRGDIGGLLVDADLKSSAEAVTFPTTVIRIHELSIYLSSTLMF